MKKPDEATVRQARDYFSQELDQVLANWNSNEIKLSSELHEVTRKHLSELGIFQRQPGSTIVFFTENIRRLLAEKMINFLFPVDGAAAREPAQPPITQEVVELKRNKNPGFSLRAVLAAQMIMKKKMETSATVRATLSEHEPDPVEEALHIKNIHTSLLYQDDGLFLIPMSATFQGGFMWYGTWSEEEFKEFRVLLQA